MRRLSRADCAARDAVDPLAPLRKQFDLARLDEQGVIYLDGNSLGALPKSASARVRRVVEDEWGLGLVRSWNSANWITLSQRVGNQIARLVGAAPGEVVVADSTSANLYKILSAAIAIASGVPGRRSQPSRAARARIVSERTNFPSDLYIADTLARTHGLVLDLIDLPDALGAAVHPDRDLHLDDEVAILLLTHVNYRTGRMLRMHDITRAAHQAGALMVWDLAHSAGAVPVNLHGDGTSDSAADFAVGCGYKYLNGGPGAPAFAWAHPKHTAWMDSEGWRQPLSGWLGHASPFEFTTDYRPGAGMSRFVCGTPPILSLAALECGVESVLAAAAYGGMFAVRQKSIELTELFIDEVESRCARYGLRLASPRRADERGSQVSFAHPTDGYAIVQALIERHVVGDFRAPDILRFGFSPLYTRFVDVWDAADRLEQVLAREEWRDPRFNVRATVT